MSVFDYFFGGDDAVARGREIDAQIAATTAGDYQPGGSAYRHAQELGGDELANSNLDRVLRDFSTGAADANDLIGQANYDATHESDSGIGKFLKNVFLLALIGGALWLFFKLGGLGWLKRIAGSSRGAMWWVVAGVTVLGLVIFQKVTTAADDAGNVGKNFGLNLKNLFGLS